MQGLHLLSSSFAAPQNLEPCPFLNLSSHSSSRGFSFNLNGCRPLLTHSSRRLSLECRYSEYFDQQQKKQQGFDAGPSPLNNSAPESRPAATGALPTRYFVGHSIYKGKAALTVEPRAPEFLALNSGAFKLTKEGVIVLQFAPAAGVRQYDWSKKQVFSLSVTEIGTLIALGPRVVEEGKVRKILKVEPLPDGSGHFFNINVQNKLINMDESIYIPVTRAEFTVLVSAFNFILPYLLGWHAYANSIKPEDTNRVNSTNSRYGDLEWNR